MNKAICILMILQLLHFPILCPDLDGECRGLPIAGLTEGNAWHLVLLGVLPNDDVDRGPIRPIDENSESSPGDTPFGDPAMISGHLNDSGHGMTEMRTLTTYLSPLVSVEGITTFRTGIASTKRFNLHGPIAPRNSILLV